VRIVRRVVAVALFFLSAGCFLAIEPGGFSTPADWSSLTASLVGATVSSAVWNHRKTATESSGIPVHLGDDQGYAIRLPESPQDWRDVKRINLLLPSYSGTAGLIEKESLVPGALIFTGVPEEELPPLIDQFSARGIAVSVDRGDLST
jgi:hypothetical protein